MIIFSLWFTDALKFTIDILEENGACEVKEDGMLVARANVRLLQEDKDLFSDLPETQEDYESYLPLKSGDIYLDLYEKGYQYKKAFQVLKYADNKSMRWVDYDFSSKLMNLISLFLKC